METDSDVKRVVVGMHEALPDSIGNSHSMGDARAGAEGRSSGEETYKALENFRDHTYPDGSKKPVYVLASHSHYYMNNIFATDKLTDNQKKQPLPGWIVGMAGAVRFALPEGAPKTALTNIYGYLLGTVSHRFFFSRSARVRYPAICSAALSGCADSLVLRTQLASWGTRNSRHNIPLCAA